MTTLDFPRVRHRHVDVEVAAGTVRLFVHEADPPEGPTLLLSLWFPSASHQFRRLIDAHGSRYHLVAPDYPGFGHTEAPAGFALEENLPESAPVIAAFLDRVSR